MKLPNLRAMSKSALSIVGIGLCMTGVVEGLRLGGFYEPVELRAYDWMLRRRATKPVDPRILVVGINEVDLQALQRITPDDATLAKALEKIQALGPRVVGIDLYRDLPQAPGTKALQRQLGAKNLIAITRLGSGVNEHVPPPAAVNAEQIGFNNLVIDGDSVVRRNLLVAENMPSFGLTIALQYLNQENIGSTPSALNPEWMKLGKVDLIPLQSTHGGYQKADVAGYQVMLNYRTDGPIAHKVSLSQVLRGELKEDWVKDRIVLIGNTAISGKDFFYTPFSATQERQHQLSGVEVHAQIVSHLIDIAKGDGHLMQVLPDWTERLWLLVVACGGGILVWKLQNPLKLLLLSGAFLLGVVSTSTGLMLVSNYWLPMIAPVTTGILSMGTVMAWRANLDQTQRKMMMVLLGQNTSKEIAAALWENRDRLMESGKLPGQALTATMMFTDLQGFSSISEKLEPAELMHWLNEYLDVMTEVIHQHGGLVNKFTGDGVFAVFGVPIARLSPEAIAQDAMNAVACAIEMEHQLGLLNEKWQAAGLTAVRMRVGICTGEVVVGSLGGRDRMEYGIIGDTVNIASRLESCVKEQQPDLCRILIAEETYRVLGTSFPVECWGEMALKGKQQLVGTYRVLR